MKTMATLRQFGMLILTTLALVLAAQPASAQDAVAGKFTLAKQVRWGLATLPAGEYSFSMKDVNSTSTILISRGIKGVAFVASTTHESQNFDGSELIVREGSVRELRLSSLGMTFYYAPSNPKHGSAEEEREMARNQVIPVTLNGK